MRTLPILGAAAGPGVTRDLPPATPEGSGAAGLPPLRDAHGRRHDYLRVSVTDRCDLACRYCMPGGGEQDHAPRSELLSFEELVRVIGVLGAAGVQRVRFTGGEPLARKGFVRLVAQVREATNVEQLVATSNGTRLAQAAGPLRAAGLHGVNISLDTVDAATFREITRGGDLACVLRGVEACLDAGLELKVNAVAMRGVNEGQLGALVDWAWKRGITPRFIELMPLGGAAKLPPGTFMGAGEVLALLGGRVRPGRRREPGHGPAEYLDAADGSGCRVGFITPLSASFCDTCNRIRLTARGDVRTCLASRRALSLRDMMRAGATDRELDRALRRSLLDKAEGHHFLDAGADEHRRVGMSLIGG